MGDKSLLKFCVETGNCNLWDKNDRKVLRSCGVEEIFIGHWFMGSDYSREKVKDLRKVLEEDGLYVKSSHPPFGSYNQPFSTLRQSLAGLKKEVEWMKEYILRCGLLGIPAIPLHTGGAMLPAAKEWEIESTRAYVNALLPAAEEAGVVIAIENTNHALPIVFYPQMEEQAELNLNIWDFDDTQKMLDFVHGFNSEFIRICYDTGHSHLLGRMLEDLDAFYDDIVLFHLHDNDGVGDDAHIQPGYGNSDWYTLFEKVGKYEKTPILYVEAPAFFKDQALMMKELNAIAQQKVIVKDGGFLKKDENTGRILILP